MDKPIVSDISSNHLFPNIAKIYLLNRRLKEVVFVDFEIHNLRKYELILVCRFIIKYFFL